MDEIDNIIFHTLRQIGCNLDDEIQNLAEFRPTQFVQIVSKCIALIDPSLDLPKTLPPGMAQRFTVTASLAEACRTIGYRRDVGYQTFLYPSVTEVRRMLMFLIEKLPKDSTDKGAAGGGPVDRTTELEARICNNLHDQLHAPWMPEFCRIDASKGINIASNQAEAGPSRSPAQIAFRSFVPRKVNLPFITEGDIASEIKEFWARRTLNLNDECLVPTLISANDGAIKSNQSGAIDENDHQANVARPVEVLNKYYETSKLDQSKPAIEVIKLHGTEGQSDSSSKAGAQGPTPLESLQGEIDKIRHQIEETTELCNTLDKKRIEINESLDMHQKAIAKLMEEKKIKERTHILLEDPDVNVKKLETIIAAGGERMKKLQDQWDSHRIPLVETLEAYRLKHSDKLSKSQQIVDEIESTRRKCEEIVADLQTKSAMHARLLKELDKLNKTISRTAYTSRILEIIGNIRKQKGGIDKILQDTRALQKDINTITGQLDRQFTVTDDLIFRNAKKDEHSKRAYKLLVTLHSDCSELIELVQETGAVKREIRELEDQIENEKSRNTAANLTQISRDLSEMQNDSLRLEESIRRLEATKRPQ